jgi:hypothetical protein
MTTCCLFVAGCLAPCGTCPQAKWYIYFMKRFTVYQDDAGQWVVECEELPGYRATGRTSEEAIEKMKSAILLFYPCRCED